MRLIMNNSTNAANSLNEFADFISKHEFAIILLIAAIFFFVFAVAKKLPLSEFETDSGIRKGFFLMGCVTFTISMILLANKPSQTLTQIQIQTQLQTSNPTPTPTSISTLTTSEAINIIDSYLDAKRLILSRKYSTEAANKHTTGKLYKDLLESISKLKSSNTYYIYGLHGLKESGDIALVGNQPAIKVKVADSYDFYNNNLKESSKRYCSYFTYYFIIDDGIWKISDYSEDSNC